LLLIVGAALPFAMVINVLGSTFFLNFIAAVSSILGIIIGFIGIIDLYQTRHSAASRKNPELRVQDSESETLR